MDIRPSAIAGSWYSSNPEVLNRELHQYLEQAEVQPPAGQIWGVIAPHAGYYYSGQVAAFAFKCLQKLQPEVVVVVSPLHQYHEAPLLTTAHRAYQTPLGLIEVDTAILHALNQVLGDHLGYGLTPLYYDHEHSLEIELPFLQAVLGNFRLIPVMMHDQHALVAKTLGQALAQVLQSKCVLLVASSDLSHFYPQKLAQKLDTELLRRVVAFDPQAVIEADEVGVGFACGRGAIAAVLWAAQQLGANRVNLVQHATSGDVSGDYSSVVGYGAAVIWQADSS